MSRSINSTNLRSNLPRFEASNRRHSESGWNASTAALTALAMSAFEEKRISKWTFRFVSLNLPCPLLEHRPTFPRWTDWVWWMFCHSPSCAIHCWWRSVMRQQSRKSLTVYALDSTYLGVFDLNHFGLFWIERLVAENWRWTGHFYIESRVTKPMEFRVRIQQRVVVVVCSVDAVVDVNLSVRCREGWAVGQIYFHACLLLIWESELDDYYDESPLRLTTAKWLTRTLAFTENMVLPIGKV